MPSQPAIYPSAMGLVAVVQRARRRRLAHLGFQEALEAGAVAMLGPPFLLMLGTAWFPESLLLLFVAAGLGVGVYRWLRIRPSPYGVAQRLDTRWGTNDQISTAYYFSENAEKAGPLAKQQQTLAAPLAAGGDIAAALPLELPKAAYVLVGIVVLIGGLFGLRYSMQSTLSLEPPLPPMVMAVLFGERTEDLWADQDAETKELSERTARSNRDERNVDEDTRREAAEPTPQIAAGEAVPEGSAEDMLALPEVEGRSVEYGDELASAEGDGQETGPEQEGLDPDRSERSGANDSASPQDPSRPDAGSMSEESNDLLSRLQEAFEKMLSSMNLEQQSAGEMGDPSGGQESQQQAEAGAQASSGEGQEAGESGGEGQDGSDAPESPKELAQGEGSSAGSNVTPQGQATSSAGSNDGSKELAEAAQLQAMGELSELYSRRAEEMSGEVLIETDAGPQELQTPYSPSEAGHRDPGGIIRRDQIPHAYRQFIQNYFEALREKN